MVADHDLQGKQQFEWSSKHVCIGDW
jgi:hypothetical protein